jgi:uncharacterized protein (TIGR03437 family)
MRLGIFFLISSFGIAAEYTTYLGDLYPRTIHAITTDAAGNTYVVGNRANPIIPTTVFISSTAPGFVTGAFLTTTPPPDDVFLSKIDPTGKVLFTNVFAGKGFDQGLAVAVDPGGNIYIGGTTDSPDFPVSNAIQSQPSTYGAGFIVKLSPDGNTILYSTYFGGVLGSTAINAMTTDAAGNLYLTGTTQASDFPHTAGMPAAAVNQTGNLQPVSAAFVASISPGGDKILFSGTVGGMNLRCSGEHDCLRILASTTGIAIALDAAKNVYFGGNTNTTDLPVTSGAFLPLGIGAFAGKIQAGGTGVAYLTYLSGTSELKAGPASTGANVLSSLIVDSGGNAYLAGNTGDAKFPATSGSYQTTFAGAVGLFNIPTNTDGFVAKLNPTGSGMVWATYLGGNGDDSVNSLAVDGAGNVWATGTTASTDFPNAQGWSKGGDFLVEFNPQGSALVYSARYPNGSVSQAVALDTTTFIHTAGATGILSEIGSTGPPASKVFGIQNVAGGLLAGRVSPAEIISIYGPHIGPSTPITAMPAGGLYPATLGGVQVTIGGISAPLLYVSDGQINAVVPMGVKQQAASAIKIGGTTYPLWIDQTDPMLFPGVFNQDASLNSRTNPAKAGSVITFYATGAQSSFAPLTDGQVAAAAINACSFTCYASTGSVLYEGPVPGVVEGVTQFNLQLGPVSGSGVQQTLVYVGVLGQSVLLWVTP